MRIEGTVWVVTGGGSGIGRHVVLQLLRRGARGVAAVDIDVAALGDTAAIAGAGTRLSTHVLDITDRVATEALVGEVQQAHGSVDGVVNNAGIIQPFEDFQHLSYEAIHRVLDVNLMGTIHMTKAFLPALLERPEAHLVNVSSMGGYFPFPGQSMYGASKAAVKLLTEGLYAELLDTSVRVSLVLPGPVETGISVNSGVVAPGGSSASSRMPLLKADDAARIMLDGIEKDRLHIFLGPIARFTDLAIRIAPAAAIRFVRTQMAKLTASQEPVPAR